MYFLVQWPNGQKGMYQFYNFDRATLDLDRAFRLHVCTCGMCNFHKHSGRALEGIIVRDYRVDCLGIDDTRKALRTAMTLEDAAINIYELISNLQDEN